ncbi:MAG: flagellar biosynthetic protein FliO [Gammaproteobacteria bacterium]|nr:MAG: flagellar biosynthetic protein FliO [Gammaproteobacteria bacterium]
MAWTLTITPAWAAADAVPSPSAQLLRLIFGLVVVVAAVFVLSRVLPRFGGRALSGQRGFRVVASLPVGQRERVVLLEVGDRQVMLGVAPGRVNTLHVLDEPVVRAGTGVGPASEVPTNWLSRTLGGRAN